MEEKTSEAVLFVAVCKSQRPIIASSRQVRSVSIIAQVQFQQRMVLAKGRFEGLRVRLGCGYGHNEQQD
jgi:hypothetical protein